MNIRPIQDRVVIRREPEEVTTAGGIVLPGSAAEKPDSGEVVAVGAGKVLKNGAQRALEVSVGDKVMFAKYAGTEVKVDGEDLLMMREDDIVAVIEG